VKTLAERRVAQAREGYLAGDYGPGTFEALVGDALGLGRPLRLRTTELVGHVAEALCAECGDTWALLDGPGRWRYEALAEAAIAAVELRGRTLDA
jgi:hypothetical protein